MRDRLIEVLDEFRLDCIGNCSKRIEGTNECHKCAYSKIADYLLENGVIVPLVKVDDDIYIIKDRQVKKQCVTEVSKHRNGKIYFHYVPYDKNGFVEHFYLPEMSKESDIGKTVFLTREEAEQELKKRKEDEGK